jgi:hypothetical protein
MISSWKAGDKIRTIQNEIIKFHIKLKFLTEGSSFFHQNKNYLLKLSKENASVLRFIPA